MLVVIGLDGATWPYIKEHLDELPTFKYLVDTYPSGELECNVRPLGSATAWTTIFTGMWPEHHRVLMDVHRLPKHLPWLWQFASRPIVLCLPVTKRPRPFCLNAKIKDAGNLAWPGTLPEIAKSTATMAELVIEHVQKEPDLLIAVFTALDKVAHCWIDNQYEMLLHYRLIDQALATLLPHIEREQFVILSDHGMCPIVEMEEAGWSARDPRQTDRSGGHSPHGLIISNAGTCRFVTQVYKMLKRLLFEEDVDDRA